MSSGGGKKENIIALAKEVKVAGYINHNLDILQDIGDKSAGLFVGYHDDYYKKFKLSGIKKEAEKILILVEKLEARIKENQFYEKE